MKRASDSEKNKDREIEPRLQTKNHEGSEVLCGKEKEAEEKHWRSNKEQKQRIPLYLWRLEFCIQCD